VITQRFLEDIPIGWSFTSAWRTISTAHFAFFTAISGDVHPIHEDEQYAAERGFPGPVAHGLLIASLTALGGTSASAELEESMLAMLDCKYTFRKPTVVGDSIRTQFTVIAVQPKSSSQGLVTFSLHVVDRQGQVRVEGTQSYLMLRRSSLRPQ